MKTYLENFQYCSFQIQQLTQLINLNQAKLDVHFFGEK